MARFVLALLASLLPAALGAGIVLGLERGLHWDRATAVGVAIGIVITLTLAFTSAGRVRQHVAFRRRMVDLEQIAANWSSTINALTARLATLEERLPDDPSQNARAMAAEIERLSAVTTRLSEQLSEFAARGPAVTRAAEARPAAAPAEEQRVERPDTETVREAVLAERAEIYLQPIVTLPQRRPHYYEALVRLRAADGSLMLPADFLPALAETGLAPRLDNLALFQAVRALRRIAARHPDVGVICNITAESLADGDFFGEFIGFAHANRALADRLIFELPQAAFARLGQVERESMATLAAMGYRFSLDGLTSPEMDFEQLGQFGFRFIKMPTGFILSQARRRRGSGEFAETMARFGIDLIADRVETEHEVIDLMDCDVRLAQGYLFAPPRPMRGDIAAIKTPGEAMAAI